MLSKRQKQVLDYVVSYQEKKGYSPALEEIKKKFGFASVSTAHFHISKLSALGYISTRKNKPRSINTTPVQEMVQVRLLGSIAAGQPIEAIGTPETIAVPKNRIQNPSEIYALRVVGNSMIDENINDGDVVLVRHQATAENGQKVVALIDNHEVTLKKYFRERGHVRLQPANQDLEPILLRNGRDISIQGIVLDVIREQGFPGMQLPEQKEAPTYKALPLNKILNGDAVDILKKIPSDSVDLVVTSPPYDDIRTYNGFTLNLHAVGTELFRVLKHGGIAAMVIQDATRNFGKTLTSFKTIVDWCDGVGFKLFETVIYRKHGTEGAWWTKRFRIDHEYMPIFLKGDRPAFFDKEPLKIPSKHGGKVMTGSGNRRTDGTTTKTVRREINGTKCRGTVWDYLMAGDKNPLKRKHPATFPDKIPTDFIRCFCPPKGLVIDPFVGCGSTVVAAKQLGRNYIGIDISKEYCELAESRLRNIPKSLFD